MKTFSLTVTQHGSRCISVAVVSDQDGGGSAVPTFGKDALRLALMYLEELSTATITGDLEHVQMMNNGRTFDELRADRGATPPMPPRLCGGCGADLSRTQNHSRGCRNEN